MHVQILDILLVRLLVVVRAEPSEALVTEVRFHWVDSADQHVETAVELLFVQDQRVVNIPLDQEFVMEGRLWQISKLLEEDDPISSSAFRGLGDKCLSWILSHVVLEVSHFVREQE